MTPNYLRQAKTMWPRAEWIEGNGPYASVAHCGVVTVTLFMTEQEAIEAHRFIDEIGCGGRCSRKHEIVSLNLRATSPRLKSHGGNFRHEIPDDDVGNTVAIAEGNREAPPDLQDWMLRHGGYAAIPWAEWDRAVAPWAAGYLKPTWVTIGFRALMAGAKGMYDGRGYMKRRH